MEIKAWWKSKVLWANVVAFGSIIGFAAAGMSLPTEAQASLIVALNLVLRIMTNSKIGIRDSKTDTSKTDNSSSSSTTENQGTKVWWKSKTVWVNVIALVALIAAKKGGFDLSTETQASLLTLVNLILRAITGSGLTMKNES